MAARTLELLETLLAGEEMTSEMLDDLLKNRVAEDLYLEYKHGDELKESKKANATVRQYASGFANSAGGILLCGVDEATWTVTGCSLPGGGSLTEWASRSLTNIAAYLSPPARFCTINHPDGKVLVIATARTPGLVPITEASGLVYYFRFHDQTLNNQTLKAPDYLISDIVLGRRQRPSLYIAESEIFGAREVGDRVSIDRPIDISFEVNFRVENRSLFWAEDVRLGIISLTKQHQQHQLPPGLSGRKLPIGNELRLYFDEQIIDKSWYSEPVELSHYGIYNSSQDRSITPFGVGLFGSQEFLNPHRLPYDRYIAFIWKAAIYILAKNCEPIWYQVSFKINSDLMNNVVAIKDKIVSPGRFLNVERLAGERAIVAWEKLLPEP